jgi:hypothetical protein
MNETGTITAVELVETIRSRAINGDVRCTIVWLMLLAGWQPKPIKG